MFLKTDSNIILDFKLNRFTPTLHGYNTYFATTENGTTCFKQNLNFIGV